MAIQYKRVIGPWAMLLCSVSSIIGSGWLFSSYYSSQLAGPAAILSWIIGACLVIIVAFTFAEISSLFAIPGGSSHLPHLTHGTTVSLVLSWISWLSTAVLPAIEVQAVLQYAAHFFPFLLDPTSVSATGLSGIGLGVAFVMMIVLSVINIYSLRWVIRFNNAFALWKIVITIIVALALISFMFHPENFSHTAGFMPSGWHGVFAAISLGGIVFAFNGFKTVVEMAGEAKNPKRTIPFALVGSLLVCLVVYLLLQIAFIGAIKPIDLVQGWSNLKFLSSASPFVGLLVIAGSVFVLFLLYVDAIFAPLGAGLIYATSGARILQAMGENHQTPHFLAALNKDGIPVRAIVINFFLGLAFFFPFPGWRHMMEFISSLIAFSYALGPICLLVLRYQLPQHARVFKLPLVKLWSFVAFYICTLMCYWTGWYVMSRLMIFLAGAAVVYFIYRFSSRTARQIKLQFLPSLWIWIYFAGLMLLSYFGTFNGGMGLLKFGPDFIAVGILALITLWAAVRWRASDAWVQERCAHLEERHLLQ